jgi:transcription elongation GreA/GreB family factor
MSDTNGNTPKPEWLERLERVEASHVKLMTDHEVFVRDYDRQQEADRAELKAYHAEWKARGEATDRRIETLVKAMGEFIASRIGR